MPETATDDEAVMLALGERLAWREIDGNAPRQYRGYPDDGSVRYYNLSGSKNPKASISITVWFHDGSSQWGPKGVVGLDAAKRICEIHAATGKWEL